MNSSPDSPETGILKVDQYEAFLEALQGDYMYNWLALANVLGVDRKTIYNWRQTQRAQNIINGEIKRLLKEMERAGEGDWRMYREKAKIMGVEDVHKVEITDTKGILDELETDYDDVGRKASGQVVEAQPPLQD